MKMENSPATVRRKIRDMRPQKFRKEYQIDTV